MNIQTVPRTMEWKENSNAKSIYEYEYIIMQMIEYLSDGKS